MVSKKVPTVKSEKRQPKKPPVIAIRKNKQGPQNGKRGELAEDTLQVSKALKINLIGTAKTSEEKRAAELVIANKKLVLQNKEKEKRAAELVLANRELAFQNKEKEKRAAELVIANKKLVLQNKEKEKRAAELVIANKELAFQNKEKEKRAAELVIANKELAFQNKEKEKRAAELVAANKELSIKAAKLKLAGEKMESLARFSSDNPNPVLRIAKDGILIYGNPVAFVLLKQWKLREGEPTPKVLQDLASKALGTEKTKTTDIPCGKRVFSIAVFPSPKDGYTNFYARDVTEREQAKEALRAAGSYNRRLIEASIDPLVAIGSDGKITDVNKATETVTGFPRERLIGDDFSKYFTEPKKADEGYQKVLKEGQVRDYPLTIRQATGKTTDVLYNATVYRNEKGIIQGVFAAARDITDIKKAEEEIQQLNIELEQRVTDRTTQLEAANKELEAFSYSISHDLRSPLRAMDGFSRILVEEHASQLPSEAQRYLGLIRKNAQQMGHLIDDLLTFSRLSRLPLKKQTVAPGEVINGVIGELRAEQDGRNIEITVGDLPTCEADPILLKQVWINLLSNAFKYTRKIENAHIEIGANQSGSECIYFVRDNGVGFDMQYVTKLFGVFQRLHRAEDYEGTGVGLAIVQRIVHRHGGRTWAEAEVNHGATFYFTLGGGL